MKPECSFHPGQILSSPMTMSPRSTLSIRSGLSKFVIQTFRMFLFRRKKWLTDIMQKRTTLRSESTKSWSPERIWHSWKLSFETITKTARVSRSRCQIQPSTWPSTSTSRMATRMSLWRGITVQESAYNFQHEPMALWEVQLNFAVHCATSGLGVSTEHLNAKQPLVRAVYRFHVYYHIRRILRRMLTPLPGTEGLTSTTTPLIWSKSGESETSTG